jgi:asparagine synthase (glutamine-hydrolysing)
MSALCAVYDPSGSPPDTQLAAMLSRMVHFDWLTSHATVLPGAPVAFGAVTFASAASPIVTTPEAAIVFDGELHGADEERRRLESRGVAPRGGSDADLLLGGWLAERDAFLARLNGAFSAVLWDGAARELLILTDRFGMRPVYVAQAGGRLLVASEINPLFVDPALDPRSSEMGAAQFFAFGHFFNDDTLFANVRAVPAASVLAFRVSDGRLTERRYWTARVPGRRISGDPGVELMEQALARAVGRRATAGEHLGLSLSGGMDARTLLAFMPAGRDLKTVSLGIEGSIDHRGATRLAALVGVPHHRQMLDQSFLANFEPFLRAMVGLTDGHYLDQGIVMSTLPTYRQLGIDFLLRGHGGELLHMRKAYSFSLDDSALSLTREALEPWLLQRLTGYMLHGVPSDLFAMDVRELARQAIRQALARIDVDRPVDAIWPLFLGQRLHRETALSMHKFNGFARVRMPFVDNDVIDAVLALPAEQKMDDSLQAAVLRRRRPDFLEVVNSNTGVRPGSHPLAVRIGQFRMRVYAKLGVRGYQPYERLGLWLRRELRPFVTETLLSDEALSHSLLHADAVRRVVEQHFEARENHTFLLMALIIFRLGQQSRTNRIQ